MILLLLSLFTFPLHFFFSLIFFLHETFTHSRMLIEQRYSSEFLATFLAFVRIHVSLTRLPTYLNSKMSHHITWSRELPTALQYRTVEMDLTALRSVQSEQTHTPFFEAHHFLRYLAQLTLNLKCLPAREYRSWLPSKRHWSFIMSLYRFLREKARKYAPAWRMSLSKNTALLFGSYTSTMASIFFDSRKKAFLSWGEITHTKPNTVWISRPWLYRAAISILGQTWQISLKSVTSMKLVDSPHALRVVCVMRRLDGM